MYIPLVYDASLYSLEAGDWRRAMGDKRCVRGYQDMCSASNAEWALGNNALIYHAGACNALASAAYLRNKSCEKLFYGRCTAMMSIAHSAGVSGSMPA